MILILSQESEISTNNVIDWVNHYNHKYYRVNFIDLLCNSPFFYIKFNNTEKSKYKLKWKDIKVIWLRRWNNLDSIERILTIYNQEEREVNIQLIEALTLEYNTISKYFFYKLRNKNWLTKPIQANVNKLLVLENALKVGIDIPETLISNGIKKIKEKDVITKAMGETLTFSYKNRLWSNYTTHLNTNQKNIPFTLFQETLQKEFEIRTFFLKGICYSMAIFSQTNNKTKVDFRKYDIQKPNRCVPYKLSKDLEDKINKLMKRLNLRTGSLDLIQTICGRTVLLEVNPIGQFGMVSYPCNYYLERELANQLIIEDI